MKNTFISFVAVVALLFAGCQTAPMTAKSRLDQQGQIVEKTTTTTTTSEGKTTTTVVEISKTPSAGDLEIKTRELEGRTKVSARGFWSGVFGPSPYYPPLYGGGYYPTGGGQDRGGYNYISSH